MSSIYLVLCLFAVARGYPSESAEEAALHAVMAAHQQSAQADAVRSRSGDAAVVLEAAGRAAAGDYAGSAAVDGVDGAQAYAAASPSSAALGYGKSGANAAQGYGASSAAPMRSGAGNEGLSRAGAEGYASSASGAENLGVSDAASAQAVGRTGDATRNVLGAQGYGAHGYGAQRYGALGYGAQGAEKDDAARAGWFSGERGKYRYRYKNRGLGMGNYYPSYPSYSAYGAYLPPAFYYSRSGEEAELNEANAGSAARAAEHEVASSHGLGADAVLVGRAGEYAEAAADKSEAAQSAGAARRGANVHVGFTASDAATRTGLPSEHSRTSADTADHSDAESYWTAGESRNHADWSNVATSEARSAAEESAGHDAAVSHRAAVESRNHAGWVSTLPYESRKSGAAEENAAQAAAGRWAAVESRNHAGWASSVPYESRNSVAAEESAAAALHAARLVQAAAAQRSGHGNAAAGLTGQAQSASA